ITEFVVPRSIPTTLAIFSSFRRPHLPRRRRRRQVPSGRRRILMSLLILSAPRPRSASSASCSPSSALLVPVISAFPMACVLSLCFALSEDPGELLVVVLLDLQDHLNAGQVEPPFFGQVPDHSHTLNVALRIQ